MRNQGAQAHLDDELRRSDLGAEAVRSDPACWLLMTDARIGPVFGVTFLSTVVDPWRFLHSQSVGAYWSPMKDGAVRVLAILKEHEVEGRLSWLESMGSPKRRSTIGRPELLLNERRLPSFAGCQAKGRALDRMIMTKAAQHLFDS